MPCRPGKRRGEGYISGLSMRATSSESRDYRHAAAGRWQRQSLQDLEQGRHRRGIPAGRSSRRLRSHGRREGPSTTSQQNLGRDRTDADDHGHAEQEGGARARQCRRAGTRLVFGHPGIPGETHCSGRAATRDPQEATPSAAGAAAAAVPGEVDGPGTTKHQRARQSVSGARESRTRGPFRRSSRSRGRRSRPRRNTRR
jgi:hypothetical protein